MTCGDPCHVGLCEISLHRIIATEGSSNNDKWPNLMVLPQEKIGTSLIVFKQSFLLLLLVQSQAGTAAEPEHPQLAVGILFPEIAHNVFTASLGFFFKI